MNRKSKIAEQFRFELVEALGKSGADLNKYLKFKFPLGRDKAEDNNAYLLGRTALHLYQVKSFSCRIKDGVGSCLKSKFGTNNDRKLHQWLKQKNNATTWKALVEKATTYCTSGWIKDSKLKVYINGVSDHNIGFTLDNTIDRPREDRAMFRSCDLNDICWNLASGKRDNRLNITLAGHTINILSRICHSKEFIQETTIASDNRYNHIPEVT